MSYLSFNRLFNKQCNNVLSFVGVTTSNTLMMYLEKHSPVHPAVEWRITYFNNHFQTVCTTCSGTNSIYHSIGLTILLPIFSWLLAR